MAMMGTPWVCEDSEIFEALDKAQGRITYAARALNVKYETLRKRINRSPELVEHLHILRRNFENTILDLAENVVITALGSQQQDPNNALKAAFFMLNAKGSSRGYANTIGKEDNRGQKIVYEVNYRSDTQDKIEVSPKEVSDPDPEGTQ